MALIADTALMLRKPDLLGERRRREGVFDRILGRMFVIIPPVNTYPWVLGGVV